MKTKINLHIILAEFSVSFFVLLFLYTAITKLADRLRFVNMMHQQPLLSPYAEMLSWSVPVAEILVVALLAFPFTRRKGLLAASSLMTLFTVYIGYMLASHSNLPCSCGGIIRQMNWTEHFWFNATSLLLGSIAYILYPKNFIATNRRSRTPVENSRRPLINF